MTVGLSTITFLDISIATSSETLKRRLALLYSDIKQSIAGLHFIAKKDDL